MDSTYVGVSANISDPPGSDDYLPWWTTSPKRRRVTERSFTYMNIRDGHLVSGPPQLIEGESLRHLWGSIHIRPGQELSISFQLSDLPPLPPAHVEATSLLFSNAGQASHVFGALPENGRVAATVVPQPTELLQVVELFGSATVGMVGRDPAPADTMAAPVAVTNDVDCGLGLRTEVRTPHGVAHGSQVCSVPSVVLPSYLFCEEREFNTCRCCTKRHARYGNYPSDS